MYANNIQIEFNFNIVFIQAFVQAQSDDGKKEFKRNSHRTSISMGNGGNLTIHFVRRSSSRRVINLVGNSVGNYNNVHQ